MTKSELKHAFSETMALEYADIPKQEDMIDFTFSDTFSTRMNMMLMEQKKITWNLIHLLKRNIAMIAIIMLGVLATACGVTQLVYFLHADLYNENREEIVQDEVIQELEYV